MTKKKCPKGISDCACHLAPSSKGKKDNKAIQFLRNYHGVSLDLGYRPTQSGRAKAKPNLNN